MVRISHDISAISPRGCDYPGLRRHSTLLTMALLFAAGRKGGEAYK